MPLSQLRTNIQRRLQANPLLIVSLKADEETTYDIFIKVLDQVKLSGATKISLASPEK